MVSLAESRLVVAGQDWFVDFLHPYQHVNVINIYIFDQTGPTSVA